MASKLTPDQKETLLFSFGITSLMLNRYYNMNNGPGFRLGDFLGGAFFTFYRPLTAGQVKRLVALQPGGNDIITSARYTRKQCVTDFMKWSAITWLDALGIGWRCKPRYVEIRKMG